MNSRTGPDGDVTTDRWDDQRSDSIKPHLIFPLSINVYSGPGRSPGGWVSMCRPRRGCVIADKYSVARGGFQSGTARALLPDMRPSLVVDWLPACSSSTDDRIAPQITLPNRAKITASTCVRDFLNLGCRTDAAGHDLRVVDCTVALVGLHGRRVARVLGHCGLGVVAAAFKVCRVCG